jgi:hypothetical protein
MCAAVIGSTPVTSIVQKHLTLTRIDAQAGSSAAVRVTLIRHALRVGLGRPSHGDVNGRPLDAPHVAEPMVSSAVDARSEAVMR